MGFANHYLPKLNLGFDTLTSYPEVSEGGNSIDGTIFLVEGAPEEITMDDVLILFDNYFCYTGFEEGNPYIEFESRTRIIIFISFDTSSLGSNANISSAKVRLTSLYNGYDESYTLGVNIYYAPLITPGYITANDFYNFGNVSLGYASATTFTADTAKEITLNSNGISNISKAGVSFFGVKPTDLPTLPYPDSGEYVGAMRFYSSDTGNSSNCPALIVTYTVPGAFTPQVTII